MRLPFGIDGVVGISLNGSTSDLPNPLEKLPAPYSKRWSVSLADSGPGFLTGILTLGGNDPVHAVARFPLLSIHGDGKSPWFDLPTLCWSFGPKNPWCGRTIFDTGTDGMVIPATALSNVPSGTALLPTDVQITASVAPNKRPLVSFLTNDLDLGTAVVLRRTTGVDVHFRLELIT
jgi:hypothetical protein